MVGWTFIIAGLTLALATLGSSLANSSSESPKEKIWSLATSAIELNGNAQSNTISIFRLNKSLLEKALSSLKDGSLRTRVPLPASTGTQTDFLMERSSILPVELQKKFPTLGVFRGYRTDSPQEKAFISVGASGLSGFITTTNGNFIIRQIDGTDDLYSVVIQQAGLDESNPTCLSESYPSDAVSHRLKSNVQTSSNNLIRTYRLAIATTGEFTSYFNCSIEETLQAVVTIVNRVSAIYESELGIRLQLISNNDILIYTNALTDPYTENSSSMMTVNQNQTNLDNTIGNQNYDLGLVLHTGKYGLAYIRSVCHPDLKGRAAVGMANRTNDTFAVDLVAHEIAHQFGANHTFNSNADLCGIHRNTATAFEPGSGSTIMAYSTLPCGNDRIQPSNDAYFHSASLEEILNYVTTDLGKYAFKIEAAPNRAPIVDAGASYSIPKATPFALTATGSDPDGDTVTYCWEQIDLGPPGSIFSSDTSEGPLFRSFPPQPSPVRYFPNHDAILGRVQAWAEQLPLHERTMRFRVTARDNSSMGRIAMDEVNITVVGDAGPFRIISPSGSASWSGEENVEWHVAGTTESPISATHVNILLSTNSGASFDYSLAKGTPNDGSEKVQLPSLHSQNCRIKIEPVNNIFLSVSPDDFSIYPATFPKLHPIARDGTKLILNWRGVPGQSYRVQETTNLAAQAWEDLPGDVNSSTENFTKEYHPKDASQHRFYRVLSISPSESNSPTLR